MYPERTGLIIWVSDLKSMKSLDRLGTVHYISKKMNYVVMYINADRTEETLKALQKLPYVKKVEKSYRNEIKTEYSNAVQDKTRFYSL